MKISVAMAACNGATFITEQLESILAQSLAPHEIVVCDDSSDNDTRDAIDSVTKSCPGIIKYHKNEHPLGVSKNFERAISLCSGDIILLSDQDDVWLTDKIQHLVAAITKSSGSVAAFCDSSLVDANLSPLGLSHWDLRGFSGDNIRKYLNSDHLGKLAFFCRQVPPAAHNMAFRADLKPLLLPFPELNECHDTWIGLIIAAAAEWNVCDESLTLFRQHRSNLSQSGKRTQLQEAFHSIRNNTFAWNAKLYHSLIERLKDKNIPSAPPVITMLNDRREHSMARSRMDGHFFKRLPLIIKEIRNQRYFKYARGWKSILQDVLLRSMVAIFILCASGLSQ